MKKYNIAFVLLLFASVSCKLIAQIKTAKLPTAKTKTLTPTPKQKETQYMRWSIKAGANISVIYLARNTKDNNNEPGYSGGLNFDINNFVRVSTLFTHFRPIDIDPTWRNIKANSGEVNLEIIAKFPNKKTMLYPFVGLSYNSYKGYFTGEQDYLNLKEYYAVNTVIKNNWVGLNLGTGIEHNFGVLGIYLDYRMRVGKQEKAFNIMDVCYTGGIKVRLPYGKVAKRFISPGQRFFWF